jgi:hypothetical protein
MNVIKADSEKPVAPLSVEVADDKNTVRHTRRLEFVAEGSEPGWRICVKCVAHNNQELCDRLPCLVGERKDGRAGYFREVSQ